VNGSTTRELQLHKMIKTSDLLTVLLFFIVGWNGVVRHV